MKIGDKVRFLNEIGGGIVTGFRGKMPMDLISRCPYVSVW